MSKFTLDGALSRLGATDFARLLEAPGFDLSLYRPDGNDPQSPHLRDEFYFIAAGSGTFEENGVAGSVAPGDVLFVAAGTPHRFRDFTADFAAWVIFIGPRRGQD